MPALVAPLSLPDHSNLPERPLVVVMFCAEWCSVCREFRPVVDATAVLHPQAVFSWMDIEDDAALLGDLDVEDFPTLAIFRAGVPVYFGITLPVANVLEQLLRTASHAQQALSHIPDELLDLRQHIFGS